MDKFAEAIAALNDMKRERVVIDYAVGGAMAIIFWSEPTATFDLDVFVLQEQAGPLVSLGGIYSWARARGYREQDEHILISDLPVQVIPAHNALATEAVQQAVGFEYEGQPVRVIRPEYLIAMYLEESARTQKRLERAAALLDEGNLDRQLLDRLVERYKLRLPENQ